VRQYKGYTGIMEIDEEAGIIFGKVIGLRDVITFQGESVAEARNAFEESVDSYLKFCAERGEEPEKPYSGRFVVRVKPEIHRALANAAEAKNTSLNALAEKLLSYGSIHKTLEFLLERHEEPRHRDLTPTAEATSSKRSKERGQPKEAVTEAKRKSAKIRRGKEES
jgi:predicted HicB family RNase H-like nuclease